MESTRGGRQSSTNSSKGTTKGGVSPDTFFEKNKLFDAFLELLNDRVSDVRETCANSFSVFHDVLGVEWTTRIALPCITDNLKHELSKAHIFNESYYVFSKGWSRSIFKYFKVISDRLEGQSAECSNCSVGGNDGMLEKI